MGETGTEPEGRNRGLARRIEEVLDRRVRAGLAADGDGVELVGVDADDIVQVRLIGSCQGCGSAAVYAMTQAIEAVIRAEIPEVRFVEAVL